MEMISLSNHTRQVLLQLARESDCLLFGEMHGTQEVPQMLLNFQDDLTALGYGALALEIPISDGPAVRDWATGVEVVPTFFSKPSYDGRGSEQTLALVRKVAAKGWHLLFFDDSKEQGFTTWQERDSMMANNFAAEWKRFCPGSKVVGVCGNLHSTLTPIDRFAELWPSFAACFQERNSELVVKTVNIVFHSGAFFNNKVQEVYYDPIAEAEVREDTGMGHTITLHLPKATPVTFLMPPPIG